MPGKHPESFTTDRDKALETETLNLLGLEHPVVRDWLDRWEALDAGNRAVYCMLDEGSVSGVLSIWYVSINTTGGQLAQQVVPIGADWEGQRSPKLEAHAADLLALAGKSSPARPDVNKIGPLLAGVATEILHRELSHSGILHEGASYSTRLIACISAIAS